jgi:sterol carrier protein 2
MPSKVYIVGVGMTQFLKPRGKVSYTELGLQASVKALIDADITYDSIQQAYCGYIYGDSTCGQRVVYQLGMTQIPVVNVNNNCSTGSTALWMGRNAILGGVDAVLCVGFEQMEPGPLKNKFKSHTAPIDKTYEVMVQTRGISRLQLMRLGKWTCDSAIIWECGDRVYGEIWCETRTFRGNRKSESCS